MATIKEWNEQPRRRAFAPQEYEPSEPELTTLQEARTLTESNLVLLRELNLENMNLTGHLTGNIIDTSMLCSLSSADCLILENPRRPLDFFVFHDDDVWKFTLRPDEPVIDQTDVLFLDVTMLLGSFSPGVIPAGTLRGMMRPSFTQRQQQQQEGEIIATSVSIQAPDGTTQRGTIDDLF